jgi:hypothetical protein
MGAKRRNHRIDTKTSKTARRLELFLRLYQSNRAVALEELELEDWDFGKTIYSPKRKVLEAVYDALLQELQLHVVARQGGEFQTHILCTLTIRLKVSDLAELRSCVISSGHCSEVLGPPSFREDIANTVRCLSSL